MTQTSPSPAPALRLPEEREGALAELLRDEAHLAERLREADIVPLLLVHTHLTGDPKWLERFAPHIKGAWSFEVYAPEEMQEELRGELVQVLRAFRDSGRPLPPAPPPELLHRMLDVAVGQPVPPEYLPLVAEEMNFGGEDLKTVRWRHKPDASTLEKYKVVVIGAGFSGIAMAAKLQEAGIDYAVIEKNDEVGGTWYENSYPGCGVDTANHFYSYSFKLNSNWDHFFAKRNEIFSYIKRCYAEMGISGHVRFEEEVVGATWDAAEAHWKVRVRRADATEYELAASAVVSATGQLNQPSYPDIPGLRDFAGPVFHTARWNHEVDLHGKRVAMIGTGASGMQVGPSVAPIVEQLTIFQRSPHWAMPNRLLFAEVSDAKKWALDGIPFYAKWFRFLLFWASSDGFHPTLKIDPDWALPKDSLNARNHEMRERLVAHITSELKGDQALIAKAVPGYPPYGKRMLRDNHWYRTLTRDNVELVTGPVRQITATGVVDGEGHEHPADVIVLATGFQAKRMLHPMDIIGTNGSIRDHWGEDDPRAHLGITVPDFPNFFLIYGPNTNLAHGGSAIFHSECQIRYIMLALREMIERDADVIEVKREPFEAYNARVDAEHSRMVWGHKGVTNWYKNKQGRVFANSPWRLVDYRNMTADFDPSEYEFQQVAS